MPDLSPASWTTIEIDRMLAESVVAAIAREQAAFDELASSYQRSVVLFGAGDLGRRVLRALRAEHLEPRAFADNDRRRWGTDVDGVPVLPPEAAAERFGRDASFVVTIWHDGFSFASVRAQLIGLSCLRVIPCLPLLWKLADRILPQYCLDLPHRVLEQRRRVRDAFQSWADVASRETFVALVRWYLRGDYDGLPPPVPRYPEDVFAVRDDEIFVDCGAYDGDTLREFIGKAGAFEQAWAIEPDPATFARLRRAVAALPSALRSKVRTLECAVGRENGSASFAATGSMSSAVAHDGATTVRRVALDTLFHDVRPTYVRMDVEGAEIDALAGARSLVGAGRTIWVISTEHRQSDLWEVPLLIRSLGGDHALFLRSHDHEGFDVVCYAVPRHRLAR